MPELLVPIHDPNRGFRVWHISEIFTGSGTGRYVPNKDDMVLDWEMGFSRVRGVDLSTGLSTLESWKGPKESLTTNEGLVLGVDVGNISDSYRVYIDTSVVPHTLACDSRLHIYGSSANSIKIFQGTDINDSSKVISAMYDNNGQLLGENIPLELVVMPDANNVAVKTAMVGYTMRQLADGETVTAVVYDDAAYVVSYSTLIVKNTSFIRTTEANKKYVTGIHLESPFLDSLDNRTIQFPVNMAVETIPLTGVVTYSDGSELRLPVNGGRFKLHGLDQFVSSIVGQTIPLVLSYYLGDNEICYGARLGANKHMSENYSATTIEFEKTYSIKIFSFPRWVDNVHGYQLEHFLYNLDRCKVYHITHLVDILDTGEFFRPMSYGVKQRLVLGVNMYEVDFNYPNYRHVQNLEVTLIQPGHLEGDKWLVGFKPNQNPMFGYGLEARGVMVNADHWRLRIDCGFNSKEEWVRNLFYRTEPLVNPNLETQAPAPNVLLVKTKLREYELSIEDWNREINIVNDLKDGENLTIEFIRRLDERDLQLGVAQIPFRQVMGF